MRQLILITRENGIQAEDQLFRHSSFAGSHAFFSTDPVVGRGTTESGVPLRDPEEVSPDPSGAIKTTPTSVDNIAPIF